MEEIFLTSAIPQDVLIYIECDFVDFPVVFSMHPSDTYMSSAIFISEKLNCVLQIFKASKSSDLDKKLILKLQRSEESVSEWVLIQVDEVAVADGYRKSFTFSGGRCNIFVREKMSLPKLFRRDREVFCMAFPKHDEQIQKDACGQHSRKKDEGINILLLQMRDLYFNGHNSDVVIKVKDKEFRVHKAILSARCPMLAALLRDDMSRKIIKLTGCDPVDFEQVLLYLYTGQVEIVSWENVASLYPLGDKFALEHLKNECDEFIENNMSVDAFCDAIKLSAERNLSTLRKCAEDFFLRNAESIVVTNKWKLLMRDNSDICIEMFMKYIKSTQRKIPVAVDAVVTDIYPMPQL